MKLSQMSTDQLADCLCIISEPVSNMMQDEGTLEIFQSIDPNKAKLIVYGVIAGKLIPYLLKSHRQNLYIIISALTGKKPEGIAKQNGLVTLKDCKEIFDKDLIDFFKSAATSSQAE
jgi:hypothetical protein